VRRLLERRARLDPRIADGLIGLAFAVAASIEVATKDHHRGPLALNILAVFALFSTFPWRRRAPLPAALAYGAAAIAMTAVLEHATDMTAELIGLLVVSYSVGAHAKLRPALLGIAGACATVVAVDAISNKLNAGDIFFPGALAVCAWLVGRAFRARTRLARELAEKALRLEHEREFYAALAARDERGRIARELHDVVAHSMTVMVIQAGAARRVLADPARSAQALATVERVGREALEELRRLLGVLGERDDAVVLAPQPGLDEVEALIGRARDAGLRVDLRVEGEPAPLPSGIDLAAYRVVQEALTNAIKHAGPVRAHVVIRYGGTDLELEVADDGAGPCEGRPSGHGLVGMRERVALYGGELHAGARAEGGFAIHARIPLEEEAAIA
jgi:signal transduction histidine kinase